MPLITLNKKFSLAFFLVQFFTTVCITGQDASVQYSPPDGFILSPHYHEQVKTIKYNAGVTITFNAPSPKNFNPTQKVRIALYALPNGNTTEQTIGKFMEPGDDWHYNIQHIGAQTRFIREQIHEYNLVTVFLENDLLSWPAWKRKNKNHASIVRDIVDTIRTIYNGFENDIVLTGHSGGGRFIFSYLDGVDSIPGFVKRISFLDSNYGYNDDYGRKLVEWLNSSDQNILTVLAYNDSVALYKGKRFVSDTGGTWYRSKMMQRFLADHFDFSTSEDSSFINYSALDGRIQILLKKNPQKKVLHTVQVELNGFIQSMLTGTEYENEGYEYYGYRVYNRYVQRSIQSLNELLIPPRPADALSGSEFMKSVEELTFEEREERIFTEFASGNMPGFIRELVLINSTFYDSDGNPHSVKYYVMPDYLSVGSNKDYCRIPMGPITAQKVADFFGASIPTRKLVDDIYKHSEIKIPPKTYYPVGNQNELVSKFVLHNKAIEHQLDSANARLGQLVAGIKKDVVVSKKLTDPDRPGHVTIYGWHKPDGLPIQPLTNIHVDWYVDYSHGIRLINNHLLIDGEMKTIDEVLRDEKLYKLLSDEDRPMIKTSY